MLPKDNVHCTALQPDLRTDLVWRSSTAVAVFCQSNKYWAGRDSKNTKEALLAWTLEILLFKYFNFKYCPFKYCHFKYCHY